jgi:DNA-binding Lrp family transcriptional regulator
MATPPVPDEILQETVAAYEAAGRNQSNAATALGIARQTLQLRLKHAAERGILLGEVFQMPPTHRLGKITVNRDAEGRVIQDWIRAEVDDDAREAAMRAVLDALKEQIPRADPTPSPSHGNVDLLNQYTVTDLHFGMLSWNEETGADYDLKIAEKLLLDWFAAAIEMSPNADTAVLAQLGDLLHHDSHTSVTPTNAHVLDADSRLQKIIRVVIRCLRRIVSMLLEKHSRVHIVMADANHDPAGGAWLREMFAAFFENEPRVTVDSSASTYYVFEHGETSLFYHHGHKRKINNVDNVFAGQFRDVYGRTKFSYAHIGHLHSDELKSTNLMKVERHETLAARDAYAANGGWLSDRSAKVITYHRSFGEVSRITISPKMLVAKDEKPSQSAATQAKKAAPIQRRGR